MAQVRLRAERLGLADAAVEVAAETSVEDIVATLSQGTTPRLLVIDSIQTMWTQTVEVGARHGDAGPRLGRRTDPLRQAHRRRRDPGRPRHQGRPDRRPARRRAHGRCRAVVRRRRLASIPHSARDQEPLRADRRDRRVRDDRHRACAKSPTPPSCSCPSAISAAPAPPSLPASRARGRSWSKFRRWSPRRRSAPRAAPWSAGTRAGCPWCWPCSKRIAAFACRAMTSISTSPADLRIQEPAADVAAAAALVSSLAHAPLPADAVYFGEVSLSGAVRPVAQTAARLKEAQKLGFTKAIVPEAARNEAPDGFSLTTIGTLANLVADIARDGAPPLRRVGRQDSLSADRRSVPRTGSAPVSVIDNGEHETAGRRGNVSAGCGCHGGDGDCRSRSPPRPRCPAPPRRSRRDARSDRSPAESATAACRSCRKNRPRAGSKARCMPIAANGSARIAAKLGLEARQRKLDLAAPAP